MNAYSLSSIINSYSSSLFVLLLRLCYRYKTAHIQIDIWRNWKSLCMYIISQRRQTSFTCPNYWPILKIISLTRTHASIRIGLDSLYDIDLTAYIRQTMMFGFDEGHVLYISMFRYVYTVVRVHGCCFLFVYIAFSLFVRHSRRCTPSRIHSAYRCRWQIAGISWPVRRH